MWKVVFALALCPPAFAQERVAAPAPEAARRVLVEKVARAAVEGKVTPGAPYSAEAINESTQTLADGNRIVQKSVMRVYRDGEGRTRREEVSDDGEVISVSIMDPVAHVSYGLDPKTRTAFRGLMFIATPRIFVKGIPESEADKRATEVAAAKLKAERDEIVRREKEEAVGGRGMIVTPAPPPPPPPPPPGFKGELMGAAAETNKEDLGRQTVEGVAATGTRTTWTIAAGAIGNLQPIKIVSEQWFSPDLQLLVLTKHSDPRTGENIYRLQNIVRAEPDRSLFSVPPDYTLKQSGIRKE
jgi:hypothetical protein